MLLLLLSVVVVAKTCMGKSILVQIKVIQPSIKASSKSDVPNNPLAGTKDATYRIMACDVVMVVVVVVVDVVVDDGQSNTIDLANGLNDRNSSVDATGSLRIGMDA